jgi:hypothetical protein
VGLFRRQKDLLSQQREELGLDRLSESRHSASEGVSRATESWHRGVSPLQLTGIHRFALPVAAVGLLAIGRGGNPFFGLVVSGGAVVFAFRQFARASRTADPPAVDEPDRPSG